MTSEGANEICRSPLVRNIRLDFRYFCADGAIANPRSPLSATSLFSSYRNENADLTLCTIFIISDPY